MPHVLFDVNKPGNDYFQTSHFLQEGSGFFQGMRYQRGNGVQRGGGVMGVLSKAWKYLGPLAKKYVAPLAKEALQALADEGMETGQKVLSDVREGKDLGDVLKSQGKQAAKNLMKKAGARLTQAGSGRVRKKPKPKKISKRSLANLRLVGQSVLASAAKRGRAANTLGLY